ncbi:TetR family transcriptional regulator [Microbacterium sp. bgisy189]|uniref:TetR family transcriptional regulator n=1 Tax=Microbacterium sp. bgisy189 TaxID=3413798 RepID=UPI003EBD40B6
MTREAGTRGHTRDDVARAAMRILDAYGLPDFTMRRLATELGVQAGALYWHFPNKQSLLAELSDRIVAQTAPVPAEQSWPARLRGEASALRSALLAHRDGAEVVSSSMALGLGSSTAHDRFVEVIAAGSPASEAVRPAATAMLLFVLGHVQYEQQLLAYDRIGLSATSGTDAGARDLHADFDFGIGLLVDGLQARAA